jgi:hypothetical protein
VAVGGEARRHDQRLGFRHHMTVPLASTGLQVWTLEALGLDTVHVETFSCWTASLGAFASNYWVVCATCHWLGGWQSSTQVILWVYWVVRVPRGITRLGPNLNRVFSFVTHWNRSGIGLRAKRVWLGYFGLWARVLCPEL